MFDLEGVVLGTVPWSADECRDVMEWYHRLVNTPKDDWELNDRFVTFEQDTGDVVELKFNQFQAKNQLGFYMAERYDQTVIAYHTFRFMQIMDFLTEHTADLQIDGFARKGEVKQLKFAGKSLGPYVSCRIRKSSLLSREKNEGNSTIARSSHVYAPYSLRKTSRANRLRCRLTSTHLT